MGGTRTERGERGPLHIVGVSGSPTAPSRTTALVTDVVQTLADRVDGLAEVVELAPLLQELARGPYRDDLGENALAALAVVESADVLVVGSPAYRASYTGLFKLFFDHIGQYALTDTEVILTATGGSDRHALLVEHQMRPLFGFFQAHTLPLGIFASERDFTDYRVSSIELRERIDSTVERALPLITRGAEPVFARADSF
jgi:FMN reductase